MTLWPTLSQATIVNRMYEVNLPVLSQDKQIQRAAFEQAFIEVLVRISGNSEVVAELNIKSASKYVQQYRYLPIPEEEKSATPVMLAMSQPKHLLWVQFNKGLIQKLLRETALPVWGQQRPNMLVWMAVRDGRNRYVLRDRDQSVIKEAVEKEAKRRGIPLIWPKYDVEDRKNVLFADIWGSFWEPISSASERYGAGAVLVARMNWAKGQWQVDWSMELAGYSQNWQLKGKDLSLLMAGGIDPATNNVSSRFAVLESGNNEDKLIVQINGINHIHSYAKASRYLSSLAPVKGVFATQVEQGSVRFNIDMTGDTNDLQRIIALGKTLALDDTVKPVEIITSVNTNGVIENLPVKPVENILTYRFN
jgi:uncharacterized protein